MQSTFIQCQPDIMGGTPVFADSRVPVRRVAVEYLKAALGELADPDNRAAGLSALRDVAATYGGLGMVAEQAGISREALYRSLSPKGNPTLKTLLAVLKSVGMQLSVEPENPVHA